MTISEPGLRRVEGIEELVHALTVDAHAGIPHGHAHTIAVLSLGSDQQLPLAIVDTHHRVGAVAEQVQDDLLELDAIAGDPREVVGEFRLKNQPAGRLLDRLRGLPGAERFRRGGRRAIP